MEQDAPGGRSSDHGTHILQALGQDPRRTSALVVPGLGRSLRGTAHGSTLGRAGVLAQSWPRRRRGHPSQSRSLPDHPPNTVARTEILRGHINIPPYICGCHHWGVYRDPPTRESGMWDSLLPKAPAPSGEWQLGARLARVPRQGRQSHYSTPPVLSRRPGDPNRPRRHSPTALWKPRRPSELTNGTGCGGRWLG